MECRNYKVKRPSLVPKGNTVVKGECPEWFACSLAVVVCHGEMRDLAVPYDEETAG